MIYDHLASQRADYPTAFNARYEATRYDAYGHLWQHRQDEPEQPAKAPATAAGRGGGPRRPSVQTTAGDMDDGRQDDGPTPSPVRLGVVKVAVVLGIVLSILLAGCGIHW